MRWSAYLVVVALALIMVGGCQIKGDKSNCVGDDGGAGGGTQVCTKPPPAQFSQMGQ
jgi:hypothetical protein